MMHESRAMNCELRQQLRLPCGGGGGYGEHWEDFHRQYHGDLTSTSGDTFFVYGNNSGSSRRRRFLVALKRVAMILVFCCLWSKWDRECFSSLLHGSCSDRSNSQETVPTNDNSFFWENLNSYTFLGWLSQLLAVRNRAILPTSSNESATKANYAMVFERRTPLLIRERNDGK